MVVYNEYLTRSLWEPSEPLHVWLTREILKNFIKKANLIPENTVLVEIGTGTGRGGEAALNMNFLSYTGVEPASDLAEYARTHKKLNVIEQSLPNLTYFKTSTIDAVFSIHVIEHASSYKDAYQWLEEMIRILRPGGNLLLVCPDIRDFKQYFWDSDWSHGFPTTPNRLSQMLIDLKMKVTYSGTMRIGRLDSLSGLVAKLISVILPTRLGDTVTKKIFGRPLVSGLKIATLWGLVFIVANKPINSQNLGK